MGTEFGILLCFTFRVLIELSQDSLTMKLDVERRPLGSCPSAKGDDLSPINQGFGQNEFLGCATLLYFQKESNLELPILLESRYATPLVGKIHQPRDSNSQKVHPSTHGRFCKSKSRSFGSLDIQNIYQHLLSESSAYIQLPICSYCPTILIRYKLLTKMENNPSQYVFILRTSRLAAEIQEQQSLLKTYEKFQSEIQNKDSEILQMPADALRRQTRKSKHGQSIIYTGACQPKNHRVLALKVVFNFCGSNPHPRNLIHICGKNSFQQPFMINLNH
ncbi:hypothetical protein NC652_006585 [Populus alba x Populus x berolinensis]|nr:hypothetical protein NC652_006585 [Populus alba x Populus x berolinensis]